MPGREHRGQAAASVGCAVLTVSDTRTEETDESGRLIGARLRAAGHRVVVYRIVPDEPAEVRALLEELCAVDAVRAVCLSGGTGLAPRDTTYEAVAGLLDKRLDGFGELFRYLSFERIGAAAMLSRATAGVRGSTIIFSIPGSTDAVELAMDRLILPELGHIVALLSQRSET